MILRLKWLSIPNFYAVQRGTPRSFKPVSDGVINLYLYINIHTDSGREVQRQYLNVPYVKITLAMNSVLLNSMQKFKTRKGSL